MHLLLTFGRIKKASGDDKEYAYLLLQGKIFPNYYGFNITILYQNRFLWVLRAYVYNCTSITFFLFFCLHGFGEGKDGQTCLLFHTAESNFQTKFKFRYEFIHFDEAQPVAHDENIETGIKTNKILHILL